jgi:cold shock CspA family protein
MGKHPIERGATFETAVTVPASSVAQTGVVCKYFIGRSFGFIVSDRDPDTDIFFHLSDVRPADRKHVAIGQRVEFVAGNRGDRPQAVQVGLI